MAWLETLVWPFLQWLWQTTLIGSLVICLILAVQKLLGRRLGPRWSHALWLVLLIRMVVPWAPQSRVSLLNLLPSSVRQAQTPPISDFIEQERASRTTVVSEAGKTTTEQQGTSSQAPREATPPGPHTRAKTQEPPRPTSLTRRQILPALWLAGAALVGAYLFAGHFVLWRIVKREHPLINQSMLELFEQCKTRMGVQTLVAVVPSDQVASPALFGFLRPRLLLPRQMLDAADRDEMRYVFLHELAHLKRHDIYLAWVAGLLQALHWFNPLVWFAFHRMRLDRELACDALVLARTGEQESQEYGRAIVALLQRLSRSRPMPAMAGILESKSQLKRRIAMIAQFKNNSYRWSPVTIGLIAILCCISLPNAKSGETARTTNTSAAAVQAATSVAGDSNVFIDPNTGIRFTKFKTISGPSDVIVYGNGAHLSPNAKFVLWGVYVVPLDGGASFKLVDIPNAGRGAWSPDGKKVVFYAGAIWLVEVDPETGRATAAPRKLLDGEYWYQDAVRWSPDSQKIIFRRRDNQIRDQLCTLSIETGEVAQIADPFSVGLPSPDGQMTVASDSQRTTSQVQYFLWVRPLIGGEPRKILEGPPCHPIVWSANSKWLVCSLAGQAVRLVRPADGKEVRVNAPGSPIKQVCQGRRLLFYQSSYDEKETLKVVSVTGGPPAEIGWPSLSFEQWYAGYQSWARNSRSILVEGKRGGDLWGLWAAPLDGSAPEPLTIDTPMCQEAYIRLFSPDGGRLLLVMGALQGTWDLWTVPVSLAQMKSTGPAVKVFGEMVPPTRVWSYYPDSWSPDGSKIAFIHDWDLWVASADGKSVLQLTKTPEPEVWPMWSPDGTMIAFGTLDALPPTARRRQLRVVSASGGESQLIVESHFEQFPLPGRPCAWLPDGKGVTMVCGSEGVIASYPLAGGEPRIVARLKDLGVERAGWLSWSPDGRFLAFQSATGRAYQKLHVYQPDDAKLQLLAEDDVAPYYWSPDSRWISYFSTQPVKTRPEGVLWEMDVDEAISKLAK